MTAVKCFFAAELRIQSPPKVAWHRHPCAEIVCYLQGFGRIAIGANEYEYHPGLVAVMPPDGEHCDKPDSAGIQLCIGVTGCRSERLGTRPMQPDVAVRTAIEAIRREVASPPELFRQERLDLLAGLLVLELRRCRRAASPQPDEDPILLLREILDSRFDEEIDISELATGFSLHEDHLRRRFKARFGEPPGEYLIRRRIEAARELLNMTALPIGEIARRVGLENVYYFSRIFRKKVGASPTEYRRGIREAPPAPKKG